MFSSQDASTVGRVYVYETVGTIFGGIACTYLLIPYLNTFQASLGLALLNIIVCCFLLVPYWKTGPFQKALLVTLGGLTVISTYSLLTGQIDRLHHFSIKAQWKNQNVVHYQNSQYGNICIIENEGQYLVFQDGIPELILPIPDIPFVEEFVHLPLLAHPNPEKIFFLSGGAGGMIHEALKHPSIQSIEYAEIDPLFLDLFRKFPTPLTESELNNGRVGIQHIDGRLLLKTTENKYDLIFIGISEPSSLQANRFFTKEFFRLAKDRLENDGILVLGLPGSFTYVNKELKNLNSCIFNTLNSVFAYIKIIPGDSGNLFLSSDSRLITQIDKVQIAERLHQRNIETNVIVPWHIEKKLHHGWQEWFSDFLEGNTKKINSDFKPVGLFYSVAHWNALYAPSLYGIFNQFEKIDIGIIALLLVCFLVIYFIVRLSNKPLCISYMPFAIITTGFAGMLFDLVLIFTFQSIYGYVFSWIGLLVASFMAGAACGAMLITKLLEKIKNHYKFFIKIELAIICFSIGMPFIFLSAQSHLNNPEAFMYFRVIFLLISFVCGLLISSQFPLANMIYLDKSNSLSKTAGLLYASDLLGGWAGGIVGAVVLLPVLGLIGTCITAALIKVASFIVIVTRPCQHLQTGQR